MFSGLTVGQNRFHVEAHGTFGRVGAADDGEAETLLAGAFLENHRRESVRKVGSRPPRQSAEFRAFLLVASASRRRRSIAVGVDDHQRRRRRRRRRLRQLLLRRRANVAHRSPELGR